MTEHYWLAEMTWPEFQAAAPHLELALVPLGATEQHGPGATFAVDTLRAEAFARLAAARFYPRAVGLPCFPYAASHDQMDFPGTITLSAATQLRVVEQVAGSLYRHGIRKLLFLTVHNGSGPVLNIALANLKDRYPDLKVGWVNLNSLVADLRESATAGMSGHADEAELSESLFLAPEAVHTDVYAPEEANAPAPTLKPVRLAVRYQEISRQGGVGNPACASRQLGETLVLAGLERLETYVNEHF